jgi:hypothetical protein
MGCKDSNERSEITVGGAMDGDALRRFIDAWHCAERGEIFHERHLAFESLETKEKERISLQKIGFVGAQ